MRREFQPEISGLCATIQLFVSIVLPFIGIKKTILSLAPQRVA